uniref:WAP domain-containing protein n=1 Tax=Hucho hucho TaxID=62062 RepID=A0A4W5KJX6_9TELE
MFNPSGRHRFFFFFTLNFEIWRLGQLRNLTFGEIERQYAEQEAQPSVSKTLLNLTFAESTKPFNSPGVCPRGRRGVGTCAEICSNDSDCPNDEKCCHNGCGHDCIAPY